MRAVNPNLANQRALVYSRNFLYEHVVIDFPSHLIVLESQRPSIGIIGSQISSEIIP